MKFILSFLCLLNTSLIGMAQNDYKISAQQPTANGQQPTANGQQPTANSQQSTAPMRWWLVTDNMPAQNKVASAI